MGQIVDTETAQEFMKETLEKVDPGELSAIAAELGNKSRWLRKRLTAEAIDGLTQDDFLAIFRRIFSVRRKAPAIIEGLAAEGRGVEGCRQWARDLLHSAVPVDARFGRAVDSLGEIEGLDNNVRRDLASELLHFHDPESSWLWTRWMWDPKTRTGALPLVTTASYDLGGETSEEIYLKVGRAVAFVHEVGEAAGFQSISRTPFGTDVFLSCVYVVYAYTVLRMRMTQEFNKVMPGLPEFSRRLLGVYQRRKPAPAAGGV